MSHVTSENIFEIIGVYFANTYWNTLYQLALDAWREEQFDKIEDAFKTMIERYSRAFCAPNDQNERINKHYLRIVKDLYMNYREFLQTGDTLLDFIDNVTKFFIPEDYYRTLSRRDPKKDVIFRKILTKSLMKFTIYISQEEAKKVTDAKLRTEKKYVVDWKKKFIDILTQERNEFCTLIMAQKSGIDIKNKDEIPQIPKEVCDKLQVKIKDLIVEKSDLIHQINKYVKYINVLKKIIREKDAEIEELGGSITEESSSEEEPVKKSNLGSRRGGSTRQINKNLRTKMTSRVSGITRKPHLVEEPKPISETEPKSKVESSKSEPEFDPALEALKSEEYSGDEFENNTKPVNVEEIELPDEEFQPDE